MPPRGLWPWTTGRKPPPKGRGAVRPRPPELSAHAGRVYLHAAVTRRTVRAGEAGVLRVERLLREDDTLLRLGIGGLPEHPPASVDVLPPREWPEELLRSAELPVFAFRPNLRARVERDAIRAPQNHVGAAHLAEGYLAGWYPGVLHAALFRRPERVHWGGPVYPEDDAAVVRYAILVRRLEQLGLAPAKALATASFALGLTRMPRVAAWQEFPVRVREPFPGDAAVTGRVLAVAGGAPWSCEGLDQTAGWRAILAGAHPRRLLPWVRLGLLAPREAARRGAAGARRAPLGLLWRVLFQTPARDTALLDAALAPYRGEVYYPEGEPAPNAALEAWWREVGAGPRAARTAAKARE